MTIFVFLQPIMALSDVDISPGFVTQLSVTPTLFRTTEVSEVCHFLY